MSERRSLFLLAHRSGKIYAKARLADIGGAIAVFRYYAGWADKIHGKTIEVKDRWSKGCVKANLRP